MKMNAVEVMQHMNVVLMLGFCLLYSYWSFSFGFGFGLFIWAAALLFLYFPNLMIIPGVTGEGMLSILTFEARIYTGIDIHEKICAVGVKDEKRRVRTIRTHTFTLSTKFNK